MTKISDGIKKVIDMGESMPPNVTIGGLKHITVKEGNEKEFEYLFRELASKVLENDKGCNYYDLYKLEESRTYLVMEQYEDKDALQRHQKSEHGKYYFPKMRTLLENIDVKYYVSIIQLRDESKR